MTTHTRPLKILHILDHSVPVHSGYAFRSQGIFHAQCKRGWLPVALTSPKHGVAAKGYPQKDETIDRVRYYRTEAVSHEALPLQAEWQIMRGLARRIRQVIEIE